jgi:hypothetical protein
MAAPGQGSAAVICDILPPQAAAEEAFGDLPAAVPRSGQLVW